MVRIDARKLGGAAAKAAAFNEGRTEDLTTSLTISIFLVISVVRKLTGGVAHNLSISFEEHSKNIRGTFGEHSGNIRDIQGTFETIGEYSGQSGNLRRCCCKG